MLKTSVLKTCPSRKSFTNQRRPVRFNYVLDTFRRLSQHFAWTRCHNNLTSAEDVCAEDVSITKKALQIEDVQYDFTTSSICLEDEKEGPSGRAVTNVGRTCGPTLLLVYLYAKAIKYV